MSEADKVVNLATRRAPQPISSIPTWTAYEGALRDHEQVRSQAFQEAWFSALGDVQKRLRSKESEWHVSHLSPGFLATDAKRATKPNIGATMTDITREEMQSTVAASEARTETRVARLEGKIETLAATLGSKIDALNDKISTADAYNRGTRGWIIGTIVAVSLALGGLIVTLATYGDAMFSRGMDVKEVIQTTVKETMAQQHNVPPGK